MLLIDVSNNNGSVDFSRVARAGIKGVFLKATEGSTFVDATFARRREEAQRAGLYVGAYHFARPDTGGASLFDASTEARHFCSVVKSLRATDLRPVLDLEHGTPREAYVPWARQWNAVVRGKLGVGPLFYSYPYYITGLHASWPIGYGLWLASYGRNDGVRYRASAPAPWKRFVLHQFTSNGRVDGVRGDCDVNYCESLRPLLAFPWRALAASPYMALRRVA